MLLTALLLTQAITAPPRPNPSAYLLIKYDKASAPPAIKPVAPSFPDELRKAVQVTIVVVAVVTDREGRVCHAAVVEGDSKARHAALRAAVQWSLEPPDDRFPQPVKLYFMFSTLPASTPPKELATVFYGKYGVEVRATVTPGPLEPQAEAPPQ